MRKIATVCWILLFVIASGSYAKAQDASNSEGQPKASAVPAHYFHLEFVLQELGADGKTVNSRTYTSNVSTDSRNQYVSIRATSRIPIPIGPTHKDSSGADVPMQFQYQEVGISIDARDTREVNGQLALYLVADITSLAPPSRPTNPGDSVLREAVVRENKWQSFALIRLGKPTVVFTSDALDSKGSMQLLVTATPLQ